MYCVQTTGILQLNKLYTHSDRSDLHECESSGFVGVFVGYQANILDRYVREISQSPLDLLLRGPVVQPSEHQYCNKVQGHVKRTDFRLSARK